MRASTARSVRTVKVFRCAQRAEDLPCRTTCRLARFEALGAAPIDPEWITTLVIGYKPRVTGQRSSGGKNAPRGDWSAVVGDLEADVPKPSTTDLQLDEPSTPEIELVDHPNAVGNEGFFDQPSSGEGAQSSTLEIEDDLGLSLPAPDPEPAPSANVRRPAATKLPDAVPRSLFEAASAPPARGAAQRGPRGPTAIGTPPRKKTIALANVLGVVFLLVVAGGAFGAFHMMTRPPPPPPPGSISVVSDPEGAEIFMDGRRTGLQTPAALESLPAGDKVEVSVRRAGFMASPKQKTVEVISEQRRTAFFALSAVRSVVVTSDPPGAEVRLNGRVVPGVTPLRIPSLEVGSVARFEVVMSGFLPVSIEHTVGELDETLEPVELAPAATLSVVTEPGGATVTVGGRVIGITPIYDAEVQRGIRVPVKVEKSGFRTVTRKIRLRDSETLRLSLKQLPLSAMKLRPQDRKEARRIDRTISQLQRSAERARRILRRTESNLQRVLDNPDSMFGERARAEAAVDKASAQLTKVEEALFQARDEADRFRARMIPVDNDSF